MIGKVIIVSCVLSVLVGEAATTTGGQTKPDESELEAYEQVNMLLGTCDWPESVHSDSSYSLAKAVALLRQSLEDISQNAPKTESSQSAQVRGYTVKLAEELLRLHDLIETPKDSDRFESASEPVGLRILDMVKAGKQLAELENMLVALVTAREERVERRDGQKSKRSFWCKLWHKICD